MNLIQILKNVNKGKQLYSPLFGNVVFVGIEYSVNEEKIRVKAEDGNEYLFYENGEFFKGFSEYECMLFPSKNSKNWMSFAMEYGGWINVKDSLPYEYGYNEYNSSCNVIVWLSLGGICLSYMKKNENNKWEWNIELENPSDKVVYWMFIPKVKL